MFVKKVKMKNGKHFLQLVEGYRENGRVKHRAIKKLGILEELEKDNPNILEELKKKYKDKTVQKQEKYNKVINLKEIKRYEEKNYGYLVLKAVYENIGISDFMKTFQRTKKVQFDLNEIFQMLVYGRIMFPDSKLGTYENRNSLWGNAGQYDLNSIYRSLDLFSECKDELQLEIHKTIQKKYGRDLTLLFYDVTNYYFEIHENDSDIVDINGNVKEGFRKKGCSKKFVPQPLVAMGLIIDKNNIPVAYQLFRGNTSDTKTLIPMMDKVLKQYEIERVIVVADKGLNSEDNLNYLANENTEDDIALGGNGYIVSQTILGASKELKLLAIDQSGYIENVEKNYKRKSIVRDRVLHRIKDGKKIKETKIEVKEKVVFFWSENYARRRQYKREEEKKKIEYFIKNQNVLPKLDKGLKSYIKEEVVSKSGEPIKNAKIRYVFDEQKFNESMKYDGYYAIISSETDLSDDDIIEKYRGLSEIENSFRILQSNLDGRPVYVRKESRIEAHFLICFIGLIIIRVLQNLTGRKYSADNLIEAINSANLHTLTNAYLSFSCTSEIFKNIEKLFDIKNSFNILEVENFTRYEKDLLYNIKEASFC